MATKKKPKLQAEEKTTTTQQRHGDTLVTVTTTIITRSAIIEFQNILAAAELKDAEDWDEPWKNDDAYAHGLDPVDEDLVDVKECRSAVRDKRGGDWKRIVLPNFVIAKYAHFRGASKQVAQELEAAEIRRTLDSLQTMYGHGWESYYATCEYLGELDSLGGITTWEGQSGFDEYAEDLKFEVACSVAGQLEAQGYEIVGLDYLQRERRLLAYRQRYRRQIHQHDWDPS